VASRCFVYSSQILDLAQHPFPKFRAQRVARHDIHTMEQTLFEELGQSYQVKQIGILVKIDKHVDVAGQSTQQMGAPRADARREEQAMKTVTGKAEVKTFNTPEEIRTFPKGRLELVKIGGATVGRAVFEPGWRWKTSVQPLAHTKSCEAPHFQYHADGKLHIVMDDGTEFDCNPGDVSLLPEGHDAWVVGDEEAVIVDFQGMIDYAKAA
jgi:hypothetical protein